jgi:hypothetical protein
LAQLLVFRPFGISYFAHQPWLNPLTILDGEIVALDKDGVPRFQLNPIVVADSPQSKPE